MNSVKKEEDEVQKLYDNMKRNLVETANIATDTLCTLNDQGNKIDRINNEMDTVDKKVDKSYKLVNKMSFMKSIFGYLTLKKTKLDKTKIEKEDYIPSLKNELTINNKNDKENELDEMFSDDETNIHQNILVQANNNTLILENIDMLPINYQQKLLFFL